VSDESYYGRPILKEPVWTWEVPVYFFTGGLGAGATLLSLGARAAGSDRLARRTLFLGAAADAVSPLLLVSDLGRPERFLNMLRVFKVTSPMSVGSWVLAASGGASGVAATCEALGILPRLKRAAESFAALLAPVLATYTAVLLADTAIPAWHEAGRELPFVFAGTSATTAGAAALMLVPPVEAAPARRLLLLGALTEGAAMHLMERRLGDLAGPYSEGSCGRFTRLAQGLTLAGTALAAALGRRRRGAAVAGGALVLAGGLCLRLAVFRAGSQSARDPRYTVGPQRERIRSGETRGAERRAAVAG
jgi:formate-dependent nitrite reductase membrane component NrfD